MQQQTHRTQRYEVTKTHSLTWLEGGLRRWKWTWVNVHMNTQTGTNVKWPKIWGAYKATDLKTNGNRYTNTGLHRRPSDGHQPHKIIKHRYTAQNSRIWAHWCAVVMFSIPYQRISMGSILMKPIPNYHSMIGFKSSLVQAHKNTSVIHCPHNHSQVSKVV